MKMLPEPEIRGAVEEMRKMPSTLARFAARMQAVSGTGLPAQIRMMSREFRLRQREAAALVQAFHLYML